MRICILWNDDYALLKSVMEEVIEEYSLFCVVCSANSTAYRWAKEYGAPTELLNLNGYNEDYIIKRLIKSVDYAVIAYEGENNMARKMIMNMKAAGKHGKVIKIKEEK